MSDFTTTHRRKGYKLEIADGKFISKPYTDKDYMIDDCRDIIHYCEQYQKAKWWHLAVRRFLVFKIDHKAKELFELLTQQHEAKE